MRWAGDDIHLDPLDRAALDALAQADRIGAAGFLTIAELAQSLHIDEPAVADTLRNLDRRGLVLIAPSRERPRLAMIATPGRAIIGADHDDTLSRRSLRPEEPSPRTSDTPPR